LATGSAWLSTTGRATWRELDNCLERAAVMLESGEIDAEPSERERVIAALERADWVQARAARLFGMTPWQIAYRL